MKTVLVWILKAYRTVISPLYGQVCRYHPSCSAYALEAVQLHGALRGSGLAVRRLVRCHPWTPGGYDPVPPRDPEQRASAELRPLADTTANDAVDRAPSAVETMSETVEERPSMPLSSSPATSRGARA